jgi:hypothetical protein
MAFVTEELPIHQVGYLTELAFRNRLFLKDAGIPFEEKRYPYDDTWKETSEKLKSQGITRTGLLPSIEYKGLVLSQVCFQSFPSQTNKLT